MLFVIAVLMLLNEVTITEGLTPYKKLIEYLNNEDLQDTCGLADVWLCKCGG